MKQFTSKTQKTGEIGEKICLNYLKKEGYIIIDTNYTQKVGEIDIIASKDDVLHFIEVKSVILKNNLSYETYNPSQNFTKKKLQKIQKTVLIYLQEKKVSHETKWQIDLYSLQIDKLHKKHKLEIVKNIIDD